MSQVFSGAVLLPGETGDGLHASIEMDSDAVRLFAGDDELGSWGRNDCDVTPAGGGTFQMDFGGEELTFTPSSPSAFAEAMTVPLAPHHETQAEDEPAATQESAYDFDAAIDEVIARVKPLTDPNDDDDILSKPLLVGIVGASAAVMAGLATMSVLL